MKELLLAFFIASMGYGLYRAGKQKGSRKGFHVGLIRGRKNRNSTNRKRGFFQRK